MRHFKYRFRFAEKILTVWAVGPKTAKVLAQAEAIKRGWDYTLCEAIYR